jgi:hypothetical protein
MLTLFLSVDLGASNPFDLFFNLIYSLLSAFMAFALFTLPRIWHINNTIQSLEDRSDELLRLISSPDDIRAACRRVYTWQADKWLVCVCVRACARARAYVNNHIPCPRAWGVGTRSWWLYKRFASVPEHIFAKQARRGASMAFIHLAPCKVHQLYCICQVHRQWDGSFREDQWPCHDVQTVCCRLLTAEAWLRPQYSPCKVCTLRNGTGSGYRVEVLRCECSFHQRPILVTVSHQRDSGPITGRSSNSLTPQQQQQQQ